MTESSNEEIKFQVGRTYMTRSIGDHECKIYVTIARRTAKFVTTTDGDRLGVRVWRGAEHIKPWGHYSMAPSVGADQCVEDKLIEEISN